MGEPGGRGARSELLRFAALAFAGTAALHLAMPLLDLRFSLEPNSPALLLYLGGLAMPSAAALFACARGARRAFLRGLLRCRAPAGVWASALLAQPGMVALAWVLLRATGGEVAPRGPPPGPELALLAAGQLLVVLGEEPGWRGFALPRLERLTTPRRATLVLALAWGLWHGPMFLVPGSFQAGSSPWLFAGSIFAWSAIHTALFHRSAPGIGPNLVFHASANLTLQAGLAPPGLEPFLLASYLLVGLAVWSRLRPDAG